MAGTNKYTSVNFNDIYEKKITNPNTKHSSSSSPSKPIISNSRIHCGMLVLSRPSPKTISQPSPPPPPPPLPPSQVIPDPTRLEEDSISLRPLGRTGSGPSLPPSVLPEKELQSLAKPDRFVPPHLRPGFVGKEERSEPVVRFREFGGHRQEQFVPGNRYGEDKRPNSGGGYERMRRVADSGLPEMKRPGSSETRPSSSGLWYCSY